MNRNALGGLSALGFVLVMTWLADCRRSSRHETAPVKPGQSSPPVGNSRYQLESHSLPAVPTADESLIHALTGVWRGEAAGGVVTSFSFEPGGRASCWISQVEPSGQLRSLGGGFGTWSVRLGQLSIEWTEASNPGFRDRVGTVARSPIRVLGENAVQLSGVEGDGIPRTYWRIRR